MFHSPNDQVFSMAIWRNDPIYSGSLTNKLSILSNQIKQSLIKQGFGGIIQHNLNPSIMIGVRNTPRHLKSL